MSLLLMLPSRDLPPVVRRTILVRLYRATARAFGCPTPPLRGLAPEEVLSRYAGFTSHQVRAARENGTDLDAVQARLYREAFTLGRWCGRVIGVRTVADVMASGRTLYRNLEIDFRGNSGGQVVIPRCFFSRWYTPETCRVMSAMDRGILAGLMGNGELEFHARITEGAPCCLAHFSALGERRST